MTREVLHSFIQQNKLAVLSTVGTASSPQSALIGIAVSPDLEIVFDTVRTSRKYANLTSNPACSLVIGWTGEQTLQYEGVAEELKGDELAPFQDVYFKAWPECREHQTWPDIVYFVVKPTWLRYSDFDRNPPLISQLSFAAQG